MIDTTRKHVTVIMPVKPIETVLKTAGCAEYQIMFIIKNLRQLYS